MIWCFHQKEGEEEEQDEDERKRDELEQKNLEQLDELEVRRDMPLSCEEGLTDIVLVSRRKSTLTHELSMNTGRNGWPN